jgi:cell division protein FtsN
MKAVFSFFFVIIIHGCTLTDEATKDSRKNLDVYVFEETTKQVTTEIKKDSLIVNEKSVEISDIPKTDSEQTFIVQVGAFTSRERADQFIRENKSKVDKQMLIVYRQDINLYAVQLPAFSNKTDAEDAKNQIGKIPQFKGAFIISLPLN